MANLDKLTQFFLQARSQEDKPFVREQNAITPSDYFTLARLKELLSNPLLTPDWIQVALKGQALPIADDFLWKTVQHKKLCFLDKARLNEAITKGASVVLEGLDILDPRLHALCAEIDAQLPCAIINCEAFFSQRNNEAYGGHCDSDDVLVMQLEGQKRWRIHQPQQRRYKGNSPMNEQQMGPLLAEMVMNPGDIMFLRAGVPHRVITEVPYSLHLSFDLCDRTPNIEEITHAANQMHAECLAPMNAPAAQVVDHYIQHLKSDRFTQLLSAATEHKKGQARQFRQQMGKVGKITALDKFL